MLSLAWLAAIGFAIGFLAHVLMHVLLPGRGSMGWLHEPALGALGSLAGGFLFGLVTGGLREQGVEAPGLLGAVLGALIVLLHDNRWRARREPASRDRTP